MMNSPNNRKKAERMALLRQDIISQLYKRGYPYREIREEVMARLNLKHYSLQTLHKDVHALLDEWRQVRLTNTDEAIDLELQRIDDVIREAWAAWEKSKQDGEKSRQKMRGIPAPPPDPNAPGGSGNQPKEGEIVTVSVEKNMEDVINCGDPRYLDIIHKNLQERRKLLGLYSPEKREVSGDLTFGQLLMQTGLVDNAEQ